MFTWTIHLIFQIEQYAPVKNFKINIDKRKQIDQVNLSHKPDYELI